MPLTFFASSTQNDETVPDLYKRVQDTMLEKWEEHCDPNTYKDKNYILFKSKYSGVPGDRVNIILTQIFQPISPRGQQLKPKDETFNSTIQRIHKALEELNLSKDPKLSSIKAGIAKINTLVNSNNNNHNSCSTP